jgi:hypothetical protein
MIHTAVDQLAFDHQKGLLLTDVGGDGSGAVRYAAAMYFYNLEMIPAGLLEIYRMCSKFDHEDPIGVAEFEGIALPISDKGLLVWRAAE